MTGRDVVMLGIGAFVGWHAAWIGLRFALGRRPDVADSIKRKWGS